MAVIRFITRCDIYVALCKFSGRFSTLLNCIQLTCDTYILQPINCSVLWERENSNRSRRKGTTLVLKYLKEQSYFYNRPKTAKTIPNFVLPKYWLFYELSLDSSQGIICRYGRFGLRLGVGGVVVNFIFIFFVCIE